VRAVRERLEEQTRLELTLRQQVRGLTQALQRSGRRMPQPRQGESPGLGAALSTPMTDHAHALSPRSLDLSLTAQMQQESNACTSASAAPRAMRLKGSGNARARGSSANRRAGGAGQGGLCDTNAPPPHLSLLASLHILRPSATVPLQIVPLHIVPLHIVPLRIVGRC
jgi:hypothetical protein